MHVTHVSVLSIIVQGSSSKLSLFIVQVMSPCFIVHAVLYGGLIGACTGGRQQSLILKKKHEK